MAAEVESKRSLKHYLVPLFLGGIMVLSIFGAILGSFSGPQQNPNVRDYKGVQFSHSDKGWEGAGIITMYGPWELESGYPSLSFGQLQRTGKIYLSTMPNDAIFGAARDFFFALKPKVSVVPACPEEGTGCEDMPLKTCSDANEQQTVVILRTGDERTATSDKNCVTVIGDGDYLTHLIDYNLYVMQGILP